MARRAPSTGFAPLAAPDARVLVLGTLPGPRSLAAHQYYAHPRNAFWPVFAGLLAPFPEDYAGRVRALAGAGIAVWDVLAQAPRDGALDSRIERAAARANDFEAFYNAHPRIGALLFNGAEASKLYRRLVLPGLAAEWRGLVIEVLPSTSPTHTLRIPAKREAWAAALARHLPLRDRVRVRTA
jgi:hypoxanthine-DNA glycosylase